MTDDVIAHVEGRIGRIRLNRPAALHALTTAMCRRMTDALLAWRYDDSIAAIMIDHAQGRGFCAGGDIAMLARSTRNDCVEAEEFFHAEYRLNHLLFTYPRPVICFMDGVTMGGGAGLALPARYRVATERTIFAMPETGIGLFPDVGGGWYLPRLPGRTGVWIATTGARIDGADALALGIATHVVPSDRLDTLKRQLVADPANPAAILAAATHRPPPTLPPATRAAIDRLFAADRYEDIIAALAADDSALAREQGAILATRSPQSVKVALRQLAQGARLTDFADEMAMEYALALHIIRRPDFVEGVRAVLIDKDGQPRWHPPTPQSADDALIDSLFAPLPPDRAWTPLPDSAHQGRPADAL